MEMEEKENIYDRQKNLDLKVPTSAVVIGVGGVGSWVALDLAMIGVKELYIVDPDIVEKTNLNRTPFKLSQIGLPKVSAISELILERRNDVKIYSFKSDIEMVVNVIPKNTVIIDCRDNSIPIKLLSFKKYNLITGGYDGKSITIFTDFDPRNFWGESHTYTIIPSYIVPPQFIASIIVNYIVSDIPRKHRILTINIDEIIDAIEFYLENRTPSLPSKNNEKVSKNVELRGDSNDKKE